MNFSYGAIALAAFTPLRVAKYLATKCELKFYGYTAVVAWVVARFSPSLNAPFTFTSSDGSQRSHIWMGQYGERVARAWLRSQGCKILAENYRSPRRGEVDIIARDGKLLLFIEVKTRRTNSKIRGLDAVGKSKQQLIERGANSWLKRLGTRDIPWRFDVIEVSVQEGGKPHVNHVRDAF